MQANIEQYLGSFMEWAGEQGRAVAELDARAGDTDELMKRLEGLEAEVVTLRRCLSSSR